MTSCSHVWPRPENGFKSTKSHVILHISTLWQNMFDKTAIPAGHRCYQVWPGPAQISVCVFPKMISNIFWNGLAKRNKINAYPIDHWAESVLVKSQGDLMKLNLKPLPSGVPLKNENDVSLQDQWLLPHPSLAWFFFVFTFFVFGGKKFILFFLCRLLHGIWSLFSCLNI